MLIILLLLRIKQIKYLSMIKSTTLTFLLFIGLSIWGFGNQQKADSLNYEVVNTSDKVKKASLIIDYCWEIKYENLDESLTKTIQAIKVLKKAKEENELAKGLSYMGVYMYLQDSIPQAIKYLEQAEAILLTIDDPKLLTRVYNNFGVFYKSLFDTQTALEYYQKSLEIKEKYIEDADLSPNLINISSILYDQGKYKECIDINEQALIYALKHDDFETIAVVYSNLGAANERLGNYKKSINYALQALAIYQNQVNNKSCEATTYSNLGTNYLSQGLYTDARYYFLMALEINTKINNLSNLAVSYNNLSELERQSKNLDLAKEYGLLALELSEDNRNFEELRISYEELSLIAEDQENFKEGLFYYKKYVALGDSLMEINQNLTTQKALTQNQLELEKHQAQKDIKAKEIFVKKSNILSAFFAILILLVLIWLIIHIKFPNDYQKTILALNYLIPFLLSTTSSFYILLKSSLPQIAGLTVNVIVHLTVVFIGLGIHYLLDFYSIKIRNDRN